MIIDYIHLDVIFKMFSAYYKSVSPSDDYLMKLKNVVGGACLLAENNGLWSHGIKEYKKIYILCFRILTLFS